MPEGRLERRLMDRLHGQLDAWQPSRPDPAQARYRDLALLEQAGGRPLVKGLGFGFVAGAVATCAFLILLTGSAQPQVWLDRAQGSVRHLEENIVESRQPAASPPPTAPAQPSPPPSRGGAPGSGSGRPPSAPTAMVTQTNQHDGGPGPSGPAPMPAPTPSPASGDGVSGGGGGHDGRNSGPSPSPSPNSSDGGSGHR